MRPIDCLAPAYRKLYTAAMLAYRNNRPLTEEMKQACRIYKAAAMRIRMEKANGKLSRPELLPSGLK